MSDFGFSGESARGREKTHDGPYRGRGRRGPAGPGPRTGLPSFTATERGVIVTGIVAFGVLVLLELVLLTVRVRSLRRGLAALQGDAPPDEHAVSRRLDQLTADTAQLFASINALAPLLAPPAGPVPVADSVGPTVPLDQLNAHLAVRVTITEAATLIQQALAPLRRQLDSLSRFRDKIGQAAEPEPIAAVRSGLRVCQTPSYGDVFFPTDVTGSAYTTGAAPGPDPDPAYNEAQLDALKPVRAILPTVPVQ
jgi:hypothetical protein